MSTYCQRADLNDVFGTANINSYGTIDEGDGSTEITSRVTRAIAWASAEIDDFARLGEYTIPLADSSGSTPTTIEHLATVLAGVWLYENQGVLDWAPNTNQPTHRYGYMKRWARMMLQEIRDGKRKLDAVL